MFSVDVRQDARCAVFALRGELDFDSMVQLREAGETELREGPGAGPVVIDCAALSFCDSSGIGALLHLRQRLAEQGRALRLAALPPKVSRLFKLTGLDQVLSVYADASGAVAAGTDERDGPAGGDGPAQPSEGHSA
ncbi:STAS domain-containing protein [Streptomyces sp. NPDC046985]|uniref:STAS domain-containing protein n=1 Tax=Streptomyces sp. NPDC046985 TaxID=3155377 RepID=UPI00340876FA